MSVNNRRSSTLDSFDSPPTKFGTLISEQNMAYNESLLEDLLKSNQQILNHLDEYAMEKEEQDRLDRIEKLNSMSASERREYILNRRAITTTTQSNYLNVTNAEFDLIPPDYLLLYTLCSSKGNHYNVAYSIEKLVQDQKVIVNPSNDKVIYVKLPITESSDYYVDLSTSSQNSTKLGTDDQWDITLLQMNVDKIRGINRKSQTVVETVIHEDSHVPNFVEFRDEVRSSNSPVRSSSVVHSDPPISKIRIDKIKEQSQEKLSQLGIGFVSMDSLTHNIELYIYSEFTDEEIIQKVIELVLENKIYN